MVSQCPGWAMYGHGVELNAQLNGVFLLVYASISEEVVVFLVCGTVILCCVNFLCGLPRWGPCIVCTLWFI